MPIKTASIPATEVSVVVTSFVDLLSPDLPTGASRTCQATFSIEEGNKRVAVLGNRIFLIDSGEPHELVFTFEPGPTGAKYIPLGISIRQVKPQPPADLLGLINFPLDGRKLDGTTTVRIRDEFSPKLGPDAWMSYQANLLIQSPEGAIGLIDPGIENVGPDPKANPKPAVSGGTRKKVR